MKDSIRVINLINLFLDPTLVSEEEAKLLLKEDGYNIEELERKKLEALEMLAKNKIRILAEQNKKILNKVDDKDLPDEQNHASSPFNLAASDGSDCHDVKDDLELLKKLKAEKDKKD